MGGWKIANGNTHWLRYAHLTVTNKVKGGIATCMIHLGQIGVLGAAAFVLIGE